MNVGSLQKPPSTQGTLYFSFHDEFPMTYLLKIHYEKHAAFIAHMCRLCKKLTQDTINLGF